MWSCDLWYRIYGGENFTQSLTGNYVRVRERVMAEATYPSGQQEGLPRNSSFNQRLDELKKFASSSFTRARQVRETRCLLPANTAAQLNSRLSKWIGWDIGSICNLLSNTLGRIWQYAAVYNLSDGFREEMAVCSIFV